MSKASEADELIDMREHLPDDLNGLDSELKVMTRVGMDELTHVHSFDGLSDDKLDISREKSLHEHALDIVLDIEGSFSEDNRFINIEEGYALATPSLLKG